MTDAAADRERPFGLRFLQDALNTPLNAPALRELASAHGDPGFGERPFDAENWSSAAQRLHEVFAESDAERASALLNSALASSAARTELIPLDDGRWALRPAVTADAPAHDALMTVGAFALATWLADRGRCAWGVCAADGCERVFVDEGRRHPQRFCSSTCATRTRVAAYRRRGAQ